MKKIILPFLWVLISCTGNAQNSDQKIRVGAEVLIGNHLSELEGKRVGLVMNPTARINGVHVLDSLLTLGVNVVSLFAPEHGFRGSFADGEVIKDGIDQASGLPVHSLYGRNKKPTKEMMTDVDILIFDMQDVGARFFTYNSTMKNIIEAAAEFDKTVWILDRPNPAGGNYVSGWILEDEYPSFIGSVPVPVAHGLTLGELALMGTGEGWFETDKAPDLKVIKMEGWKRSMTWPETGIPWFPPSPNLPTFEQAFVYLGTCFFEGVNISEGRGTEDSFLKIGSPDVMFDPAELTYLEEQYNVVLDTISFTPRSMPGRAVDPKFEDQLIHGVSISITPAFSDPVMFGLDLLDLFRRELEENDKEFTYRDHLFLLSGTRLILDWEDIPQWKQEVDAFKLQREPYLLYD